MVDVPKMLPYQAPDIDDITGIDSSDDADEAAAGTGPGTGPAQVGINHVRHHWLHRQLARRRRS